LKIVTFVTLLIVTAINILAEENSARAPSPTRWALDGGYGLRLWDASNGSSEQRAYEEKARQGWVLGGDVSVFPLKNFGVGVAYHRVMTTITDDDIGFGDGSRGKSTDIYLIEFVGPCLYWKPPVFGRKSPWSGIVQVGGGVIYYDNQHQASDFPGVLQSVAPGYQAALSLDYRVWRWLSVGVTARVLYGTLDELAYNGIDIPVPPISLTRVDLAGGVRFYP
jgi:hypothetical protein